MSDVVNTVEFDVVDEWKAPTWTSNLVDGGGDEQLTMAYVLGPYINLVSIKQQQWEKASSLHYNHIMYLSYVCCTTSVQ